MMRRFSGKCWQCLARGVVGLVAIGLPGLAERVAFADDSMVQIVEPSPNFRSWAFRPTAITVAVGDTITWTNTGGAPHTVTALDKTFDSGSMAPRADFSWKATAPGTYSYICTFHPWMTGSVVVTAPATPDRTAVAQIPTRLQIISISLGVLALALLAFRMMVKYLS